MTQFTEYASVGREMAALVLFSGGQDSTTCLGWALERFGRVETIGVDYGQRHQAELECRVRVREKMAQLKPQWGERLGDDHLLKLPVLGEIADCALTDERRFVRCFCRYAGNIAMRYFRNNKKSLLVYPRMRRDFFVGFENFSCTIE